MDNNNRGSRRSSPTDRSSDVQASFDMDGEFTEPLREARSSSLLSFNIRLWILIL
jgi:hypothetical protein